MALSPQALADLRQDYSQRALDLSDLAPEPLRQFQVWLAEAHAAELLEPNAMTLATIDSQGQPWTRTVLLKACDEQGFAFFTNYDGAKASHLAALPQAALTFWWGALERQVNITGSVSKVPREVSERYFASRPLASQLGAWASPQSRPISERAELERRFEECRARFEGGPVPCPETWGGYVLRPRTVEFWQGRRSRLHDRFRYTLGEEAGGTPAAWRIERLAP